ncbi:hypothetical protein D9M71_162280 [compost metagenome]
MPSMLHRAGGVGKIRVSQLCVGKAAFLLERLGGLNGILQVKSYNRQCFDCLPILNAGCAQEETRFEELRKYHQSQGQRRQQCKGRRLFCCVAPAVALSPERGGNDWADCVVCFLLHGPADLFPPGSWRQCFDRLGTGAECGRPGRSLDRQFFPFRPGLCRLSAAGTGCHQGA